mgnify:CR=1 FL=1
MLLSLSAVPVRDASAQRNSYSKIIVFPDGWADILISVNLKGTEEILIQKIDGQPDDLLVVNEDGLILNYTLEGSYVGIETLGSKMINISYQTPSLTTKIADLWNFTVDLAVNKTVLLLPGNFVVVGMSTTPDSIKWEESHLSLEFQGGKIWLLYKVRRTYATTPVTPSNVKAGSKATRESTSTTATLEGLNSSTSVRSEEKSNEASGSEEGKSVTSKPEYGIGNNNQVVFLVAAAILISLMLGSYILMRRRRPPLSIKKGSLEGRILEELEKRGGVARQSDIIKALDAPRTTIWRKIRRLEKEGYVELERTEDATIVKLKKTAVGL